ncbi:hypothetical protein BDF22DRAFT_465705 [Syncephalis plumigaleata]|nr:hypothetical protein BDF22DRAFT_465705 [Syncephalis plumigaleata]
MLDTSRIVASLLLCALGTVCAQDAFGQVPFDVGVMAPAFDISQAAFDPMHPTFDQMMGNGPIAQPMIDNNNNNNDPSMFLSANQLSLQSNGHSEAPCVTCDPKDVVCPSARRVANASLSLVVVQPVQRLSVCQYHLATRNSTRSPALPSTHHTAHSPMVLLGRSFQAVIMKDQTLVVIHLVIRKDLTSPTIHSAILKVNLRSPIIHLAILKDLESHTTHSVIMKANMKSHTIHSVIQRDTISPIIHSVIRRVTMVNHTIHSVIRKVSMASHTIHLAIQKANMDMVRLWT